MSKRNTWARREQRKSIIALQDYQRAVEDRRRHLYNRIYHKHYSYRLGFACRLLFLVFFFWLFIFEGGIERVQKEIVTEVGYWEKDRNKAAGSEYLQFSTQLNNYEALLEWRAYPYVRVGDTIKVQYNYLGKAFSFKIKHEARWHPFWINWVLLGFIAFFTLLSFFYSDGLDKAARLLLKLTWMGDLIGFLYYLLIT